MARCYARTQAGSPRQKWAWRVKYWGLAPSASSSEPRSPRPGSSDPAQPPARLLVAAATGPISSVVAGPRAGALLQAEDGVVVLPVVRLNVDVGQVRTAVEQYLGVHLRQDGCVSHHLQVDLTGVGIALGLVAGGAHFG